MKPDERLVHAFAEAMAQNYTFHNSFSLYAKDYVGPMSEVLEAVLEQRGLLLDPMHYGYDYAMFTPTIGEYFPGMNTPVYAVREEVHTPAEALVETHLPPRTHGTVTGIPQSSGCPYCSSTVAHLNMCPRIAALEYYPDGTIKRVELRP